MRTFEQIITSKQEPTEEEREFAQVWLDKWHEERFERAREYMQRPAFSGYALQIILNAERPVVATMRQEFAYLINAALYSNAVVDLTAVLKQLSELVGRAVAEPDPYIHELPPS